MDIAYNDRGQRAKKTVYNPANGNISTTHYVRDVSGTVLAIYKGNVNGGKGSPVTLRELPLYGASRLRVCTVDLGTVDGAGGTYHYQLTDHLGNVRAVVGKAANGTPYVVARKDYYPFGMPMPERNQEGAYRYAYQGQEKDAETGMEAFELRLWDSRIGRWLTTDPAGQYASPYLGMGNNPISRIDPDGGADGPCPPDCGGDPNYPLTGGIQTLDEVVIGGSSGGSWGAGAAITLGGFQSAFAGSTALYQQTYPEFAGMNYGQMVDHFETNHGDRFAGEYAATEAARIKAEKEALARHLMNTGEFMIMEAEVLTVGFRSPVAISPSKFSYTLRYQGLSASTKIHGNSLSSPKETWFYKLYSNDGTFLKNGITSRGIPEARYTKSFMSDKFMGNKRLFSNRFQAYQFEYQQNLIQRGPLNLNMH